MDSKLLVINLAKNNTPDFASSSSDKTFYKFGTTNKYPYYLLNIYNNNSILNSIIGKKVDLINANIIYESDAHKTSVESLFKKEFINDVIEKMAFDLEIFNGFSLEQIYGRGQKIVEVSHLPFKDIRVGIENEDGITEKYFYSKDFKKGTWGEKQEIIEIPSFGTKGEKTLYWYGVYNPETDIYPLPQYQSAINDLETFIEISTFNNSLVKNGMIPSMLINVVGVPPGEARASVKKQLVEQYTGSENGGRILVTFSDSTDQKPTLEPAQINQAADYFKNLFDSVKSNIINQSGIHSSLIESTEGALGQRNEIAALEYSFYQNYITKRQDKILRALNEIFAFNNIAPIEFEPKKKEIVLSEGVLQAILSVDELRELAGFPPKTTQTV